MKIFTCYASGRDLAEPSGVPADVVRVDEPDRGGDAVYRRTLKEQTKTRSQAYIPRTDIPRLTEDDPKPAVSSSSNVTVFSPEYGRSTSEQREFGEGFEGPRGAAAPFGALGGGWAKARGPPSRGVHARRTPAGGVRARRTPAGGVHAGTHPLEGCPHGTHPRRGGCSAQNHPAGGGFCEHTPPWGVSQPYRL
ncbi:hypothetical protein Taro_034110 [Colocasia esculenta]|uniref:Uncharacterized protein n=1 Tax=Colocasia esculenta TaxID=4460 RepID=A0A843VZU2_COLES|nr:hypothetical protein [Colocasia esculenta]